jgi:hypothetical protein
MGRGKKSEQGSGFSVQWEGRQEYNIMAQYQCGSGFPAATIETENLFHCGG